MAKTTLTVDVEYDPDVTDPEGLATAMDRLLETALSTPGILEDYGDPRIEEFFVAFGNKPLPEERRRWVVYSLDTGELVTTRAYGSYEEAAQDAGQAEGLLVMPLVFRGMVM